MATFYLDYEGGNDGNDGTTFANRWKTFSSGATAARIAPGDTIRVMGSPAPTSLGVNGTWTDCPDYGNQRTIAISSSTNASPIAVTTATHGLSTGDYVFITGHTTNTSANGLWKVTVTSSTVFTLNGSTGNGVGGATGTFKKYTNAVVELASGVTKTIASTGNRGEGRTAWTASANVTCTQGAASLLKSGDVNDSIAIAAGFSTGLAAYKALGSAQDFSGYKQISFWIRQTTGTASSASDLSLKLCSDTAGVTAVNTINIPALVLSQNQIVTINTGGTLGSSIQSVALYVNVDRAAQTFLIDNIIACKDSTSNDSLTLNSLIGKNTGNETWYAIDSIKDTMIMLGMGKTTLNSALAGYSGTTETITTYKREPIMLAAGATIGGVQDSGTAGSLIAFEGGWDRTAMTTQNLETWYSCFNSSSFGFDTATKNYISFNKINLSGFFSGYTFTTCTYITVDNVHSNNNTEQALTFSGSTYCTVGTVYACNNNDSQGGASTIFGFTSLSHYNRINTIYAANNNQVTSTNRASVEVGYGCNRCSIGSVVACNNNQYGVYLSGDYTSVDSITAIKNSRQNSASVAGLLVNSSSIVKNAGTISNSLGYNIYLGSDAKVYNATTSGSLGTSSVRVGSPTVYLRNCVIGEATEFSLASTGYYIFSEKHDGTTDNNYIYTGSGVIVSDTTTRHTASGISWKMSPTVVINSEPAPLKLSIAKIACTASNLVTVKAWMRRDNTGLTMSLYCPGGQLAGVASDVTSSMTAAANTWEELTITFTPTEAGVIEIFATAYGGTTYNGYVDDITVTQA